MKRLLYNNIYEALEDLNAQDKGRYYICTCPECDRNEAFIYKNNLNFIQCNRENYCGERMVLQYREKEDVIDLKKEKVSESYLQLSNEQIKALDWANKVFKHMQRYYKSEALDHGYRGISEKVAKKFIIDLKSEKFVQYMFEKTEPLLGKDYSKSEWMRKRNLVFPIYGEDGRVDRILLRSSLDPDLEPKEIQLIMNPSRDTRDFFIDVPEQAETVVVSEAILDALSFREIDCNIGIIALTGANKTRQVKEYLTKNKEKFQNKNILFAMDDDRAGWVATNELVQVVKGEKIGKSYVVFDYPHSDIKDANEFLELDRVGFEKKYRESLSRLKINTKKMNKRQSFTMER